jgi:hypothetical protein
MNALLSCLIVRANLFSDVLFSTTSRSRPHRASPFRARSGRILQQSLPRQLYLLRELALLPAALTSTDSNSISELNFIFGGLPGAGAVVREVYTRERAGAEVVRALRCDALARDDEHSVYTFIRHTILVLCLVPAAVAPHVGLLLLLLSSAAKHLIEKAKLRGCREGPETK